MLEAQFVILTVYESKIFYALNDKVYVKSLLLCVADF